MIQSLKGYLLILDINKIIDLETRKIIDLLLNNNADVYLVGGAVRDYYLNYPINDLDFEIYNLDFETLKYLLKDYNYYANDTFKTIKLANIELALPRVEEKVGLNYLDYQLTFTNVSVKQAIKRRDFTINTLMYNLKETKLYDFCDGRYDLENKLLKAVDYQKFNEDSIRVLRLLKYQSKLAFKIDQTTYCLAKEMACNLWYQPHEMCASLFSTIINSKHFDLILFFDLLDNFFNVTALKNNISTSIHHPEKSLYNHLIGVLKCLFLHQINNKRDYEILFWSLFFHDYGKLDDNNNHCLASLKYFEKYQPYLLQRHKDISMVRRLINDHMVIREYSEQNDKVKMTELKKEYGNQFYLLEIIGTCDYAGRVLDFNEVEYQKRIKWYNSNILSKYKEVDNG
ncbi:hypothetical protein LJB88_05580 [Erysipelotrichaceae bacterium OttesenSCG-928-M19]|nr:hypothetical protein [Erysipelotrichaceae bacterium OttesenSCG-928-M19]